ncbi:MAG: carbohydrate ABC transporter permease [Clostridia bacterium]|nr:carbohydrate ABC transporter permease [Clostridia bacterium]
MVKNKKNVIRRSREDVVVDTVVHVLIVLMLLLTLYPILNVFSKAFSSQTAIISNAVTIYPIGFQTSTMEYVLSSNLFSTAFKNSVTVTVLGTLLSVAVTSMAAYPFSKRNLIFYKPLIMLFVFTMWFSGGLIPTYLAYKELKMLNSLKVLILPAAINVYNMLLLKNYYESLPEALEEAARIDGANKFQIFFQIVLPLSMPVLATVCLFTAVGLWNDFYSPMMYNTRTQLRTLSQYLYDMVAQSGTDLTMSTNADDLMNNTLPEAVRAASIIASITPILVVYPFLQKYFVKGALIGSVKG